MSEKLKLLIESINQKAAGINDNELLSVKHSKIGLDMAIETGGLLGQCKEELRLIKSEMKWEKWFKSNIKGFDIRTAQNYMKLYRQKTKHAAYFDDCDSIAKAYIKMADNVPATVAPQSTLTPFLETSVVPVQPAVPPVQTKKKKTLPQCLKLVKSKVKGICEMIKEHPNPEMYALLSPIAQLWLERPIEATVIDGGQVTTTTHRLSPDEVSAHLSTPVDMTPQTETESTIVITE